jgi:hypothetical protein
MEYFNDKDVRGFIGWLIIDDNLRALKNDPGPQHDLSQLPFNLETIISKEYQCNYKEDNNCDYLVYEDF